MPRSNRNFEVPQYGPNLAEARKAARLTQLQLAKLVGISQKHISQLEAGESDPRLAVAVAIADALKIPTKKFGEKFLKGIDI